MVNNLRRLKVAAIAHNDEAKVLGTAHASYPAADLKLLCPDTSLWNGKFLLQWLNSSQ